MRCGYASVILGESVSQLRERVAQPVEHLTFNQRVSGSNPDALTKDLLNLHISVQSQVADLRTWRASANAATVLVLQVVEKNDLEAND